MLARWRNLAAAGAMWASCAFGSQATPSDNPESVPVSICACRLGPEGPTAQPIYENEYWYERYYRNYWGESDSDTTSQQEPAVESQATITDEPSATDATPTDEPEVDSLGRCSDPTCPCHDVIDLDDADANLTAEEERGIEPQSSPSEFDTDTDSTDADATAIDGNGRCSDLTCPCHDEIDLEAPADETSATFDAEGLDPAGESEAAVEFDESVDATECLDSCDGGSCPCQEILSDDMSDDVTEQATEITEPDFPVNWQNIVEEPAPAANVEIYEPYSYRSNPSYEDNASDEYGYDQTGDPVPAIGSDQAVMDDEAAPLGQDELDDINLRNDGIDDGAEMSTDAQLAGTIEPESDDAGENRSEPEVSEGEESATSQEAESNGEMIQDESTGDSTDSNTESTTEEASQESEETSTTPRPSFHMFYPGCDWSPYYPSDDAPNSEAIDESFESTQPTSLRFSIAPFPGSIWINQAAVSVVTWTGKLAEQVGNLIAQSSTLND